MMRGPLLRILVLVAMLLVVSRSSTNVVCRDPDVGGTAQNNDRKFMIIGAEDTGGGGIGNLLIFFPAAFYFAAVTGRDIVITDNSVLETLRFGDFLKYMEGSKSVSSTVVRAGGYQSKSDWWVWFNTTVHCVSRITGCDPGDVMCAERHAYQRLIRGPFQSRFTEKENERIHGVPENMKHALLTLPHSYVPRFDIAVHLRAQFEHFEMQTHHNDPEFRREVDSWLNSTECAAVFAAMKERILDRCATLRPLVNISSDAFDATQADPVFIYLASDNEDVKDAFSSYLNSFVSSQAVKVMKVDSQSIYHVKNFAQFKKATNNDGLLDLVFDWYALSLANEIYAWRKGGTNMISTFVHSAQKLSGTTERSDNNNGRGIGTRGFQLIRDKRGQLRFDLFWAYQFVEDYQTAPAQQRARRRALSLAHSMRR